jgi:hypothetical protein
LLEAEQAEALAVALADPEAAFVCIRTLAADSREPITLTITLSNPY